MRDANDPSVASVTPLVAAIRRRLDEDLRRIDRAVVTTQPGFHLPATVFAEVARARRDAVAAFGSIFAVEPGGAAKQLALRWLSLTAAGFAATHDGLRAERLAPATAARKRRLARAQLTQSVEAFLELDQALGCPYGCRRRP